MTHFTDNAAEMPEEEPPEVKYRVIDYAFVADCTLYLEDETLIRRKIPGKWYTNKPISKDEWSSDAEMTLQWIVGTMHIHDPEIHSRVVKHVVHHWYRK